ncbi:FAD binding domain-containing protein [Coprinopsis sp. MPI-PUGE-AT-0042]|nr:FAD binding domain-containing protein [Coprinopsis sp. MPI-PUGE-AT-0042]
MILTFFLSQLLAVSAAFHDPRDQDPISGLKAQEEWDLLRREVGDGLFPVSPFASTCYKNFDSAECMDVREHYLNAVNRTGSPAAYVQTQWETCQSTENACLLDAAAPNSPEPTRNRTCSQGSVSPWVIEVKDSNDVSAAFRYVKRTRIPLVIKNTGHDYKGRSSAPGALSLWMHKLKGVSNFLSHLPCSYHPHHHSHDAQISFDQQFQPEGCQKGTTNPQPAVTLEAGVQWGEAYAFAERNNITIVGGADGTVGAVGGWLQGGGHGPLSNTMGMGVDRVVQFKVVTPDGQSRIANDCQNQDLFFALRGGGGGTFGVVMEATVLASPPVRLQAIIIAFTTPNVTRTTEAWSLLAEHGLKLSEDGWGGYSIAQAIVLVNPVLSPEESTKSAAAILNFGKRIQEESPNDARAISTEFPSFAAFFQFFSERFTAAQAQNLALASRLLPKDNFRTPTKRAELMSALLAVEAETPGIILLMSTPASVPSSGGTSVPEAWRKSLFHVTAKTVWQWNTTKEDISDKYGKLSSSMDRLRKITPDAAYVNESDVYEPNFEVSFWGNHYQRLLSIKRKYDPDRVLDCWQCVGWNSSSARFRCYLPIKRV